MRGFGLVFSEIKTIWIKLYDHSANVQHVKGLSVDFYRWERRFACLNSGVRTRFEKVYFAPNCMTTEKMIYLMLCVFYGSVPIFIGWGEGLRVEQRGPVRGVKKPSVKVF